MDLIYKSTCAYDKQQYHVVLMGLGQEGSDLVYGDMLGCTWVAALVGAWVVVHGWGDVVEVGNPNPLT